MFCPIRVDCYKPRQERRDWVDAFESRSWITCQSASAQENDPAHSLLVSFLRECALVFLRLFRRNGLKGLREMRRFKRFGAVPVTGFRLAWAMVHFSLLFLGACAKLLPALEFHDSRPVLLQ
jgi:hypothetical protein